MKKYDGGTEARFAFRPCGNDGLSFLSDGEENNSFVIAEKAVADFKSKAISAIIDLDLPPEVMQTVLRTIKAL